MVKRPITEIRLLNPKIYMWLYRNDMEWLKNSYPTGKENSRNRSLVRIDWENRDREMATQIVEIIDEILLERDKIIRVTKNEIGRRLGSLSTLYNQLEKLPLTKATS
ncbi:TnsD family Tn7-like transposition protein [Bacillus sp. DJP31]|uniref:TnsD family Tn7-like transposition protein n=1 Tax=Bacillus sp. DJP31 TaxID=3409789 RepID=UPI003BB6B570